MLKCPGIEKQITQKVVKCVSTSLHVLGPAVQIGKQMILDSSSKSIDISIDISQQNSFLSYANLYLISLSFSFPSQNKGTMTWSVSKVNNNAYTEFACLNEMIWDTTLQPYTC